MAKKKTTPQAVRSGDNPPLIALKDFEGMLNGKRFKFKQGDEVKATDAHIAWLRKFNVV